MRMLIYDKNNKIITFKNAAASFLKVFWPLINIYILLFILRSLTVYNLSTQNRFGDQNPNQNQMPV